MAVIVKKRVAALTASFILGLSLGAAGTNSVTGRHLDKLSIQQVELKEQLNSSQNEVAQLKKNLAERDEQRLASINVVASVNQDSLTKIEREQVELETVKFVKQKLSPLVGLELARINYHQAALIVNGREIVLNGATYLIKVDLIVVNSQMNVYVTASPSEKGP